MAVNARDAALQMQGSPKVVLFVAVLMAVQAARTGLRGRSILECKDFGLVAAAVDVVLARAVTSFAAMPFRALVRVEFRVHGGGEMRGLFKVCVNLVMTGLAGVGANIQRRICWAHIGFGLTRGLGLLCGTLFVARRGRRNS